MWEFYKSRGNILLKLLLLLYAGMLVMSASEGIAYLMLAFAIMVYLIVHSFKQIDKTATNLLLFSLSYCLLLLIRNPEIRILIYLLCPVAFYIFGRYVTEKLPYKGLVEFFLITICLFGLKTYIATIIDIGESGMINPYRAMNRTGIGDVDLAATLFGLNVSLGFVGLSAYFIKPRTKVPFYFLLLLAFGLSILTVLHLINRTGFVVLFLCTFMTLLYSNPNQATKSIFFLAIVVLIVIVFLPSMQSFLSDVGSAYSLREDEIGGGTLTLGNRLWRWIDAIQRVFTDPLGWDGKVNYNYAHNMWLDVARLTGIVPFFFLSCASIRGIRNTFFLYKIKSDCIVALLLGLMVAMLASAFVEPVLEGFDIYFYLMCMLWGVATQYQSKCVAV